MGSNETMTSASRWSGSAIVLGLLALPQALTALTVALAWQVNTWLQHGGGQRSVQLDGGAITTIAITAYGLSLWITVFAAWRWSARQGFDAEVFAFRRPTWLDAALALAGFAITFYMAPIITRWAIALFGGTGPSHRLNTQKASMLVLIVAELVLTAPFAEEVLFRGLLVAWLRRLAWPLWAICLIGSFLFACIHLSFFGLAWSVMAFFFGALLFAIRFWRRSLTPCWLIHLLFNARYVIIVPMLTSALHALGR